MPNVTTQFKKGQVAWNKGLKGLHLSPATEFKKGRPATKGSTGMKPWNYGIEYTQIQNEKHVNWRGEDAGYVAKHAWVTRNMGRPLHCTKCGKTGGTTRNYHWANLSKTYKRVLEDWVRLCVSCHKLHDLGLEVINV